MGEYVMNTIDNNNKTIIEKNDRKYEERENMLFWTYQVVKRSTWMKRAAAAARFA